VPARERGSTLLLFPAAVLIVVVLAAMAVDTSIAFLAQRELANATEAAANDAASRAIADPAFYRDDRVELSAAAVAEVAEERVRQLVDGDRHHGLTVRADARPPTGAGCPWTVRVEASSRVDHLFARALPGTGADVAVHATSVAAPRQAAGAC
jgi:Flp pilus assembly protein TadG